MATKLTRPVRRTTVVIVERRRRLVVSLYPRERSGLRAMRLRTEYELPLDAVHELAVRAHVACRSADQVARRRKAG